MAERRQTRGQSQQLQQLSVVGQSYLPGIFDVISRFPQLVNSPLSSQDEAVLATIPGHVASGVFGAGELGKILEDSALVGLANYLNNIQQQPEVLTFVPYKDWFDVIIRPAYERPIREWVRLIRSLQSSQFRLNYRHILRFYDLVVVPYKGKAVMSMEMMHAFLLFCSAANKIFVGDDGFGFTATPPMGTRIKTRLPIHEVMDRNSSLLLEFAGTKGMEMVAYEIRGISPYRYLAELLTVRSRKLPLDEVTTMYADAQSVMHYILSRAYSRQLDKMDEDGLTAFAFLATSPVYEFITDSREFWIGVLENQVEPDGGVEPLKADISKNSDRPLRVPYLFFYLLFSMVNADPHHYHYNNRIERFGRFLGEAMIYQISDSKKVELHMKADNKVLMDTDYSYGFGFNQSFGTIKWTETSAARFQVANNGVHQGDTPLHVAARAGDAELMIFLITGENSKFARGYSNTRNSRTMIPLMVFFWKVSNYYIKYVATKMNENWANLPECSALYEQHKLALEILLKDGPRLLGHQQTQPGLPVSESDSKMDTEFVHHVRRQLEEIDKPEEAGVLSSLGVRYARDYTRRLYRQVWQYFTTTPGALAKPWESY